MRYTLLEMVQRVLAAMDSDEVSTFLDTAESEQVAYVIEGVYRDMVVEIGLPRVYNLFELEETSSSSPTKMSLPTTVTEVQWVKYDNMLTGEDFVNYQEVRFMHLPDFMNLIGNFSALTTTEAGSYNISITNEGNTDTIPILYRKDAFPKYYTSFDDGTILFDSLYTTEDTYLTKAKTMCWGAVEETFTFDDDFVPNLNPQQFALLLNESKARAFVELKQAVNANAEQHARRQRIRLRNTKSRFPGDARPFHYLPNYGRK